MNKRTATVVFYGALAIGLAYFFFLAPHFDVGAYADDALYILGAQALRHGHYANLYAPGLLPLTDPLPGYPLFLAPFVALVQPHWAILKVLSALLTVGTAFLLLPLFSPILKKTETAFLALLFLWNPTTAHFAVSVLSEPCFLFCAIAIFLFMRRAIADSGDHSGWMLGALLSWAALIRPQGILLLPSVSLGLFYAGRRRAAGRALGLSAVATGLIYIRNYAVTRSLTGYMRHWKGALPILAGHPLAVAAHGLRVLETLALETLWPFPWELPPIFRAVLTLCVLAVLARGVARYLRESEGSPEAGVALALTMFCFLYGLLHMVWLSVRPLYFLPLLPFLLFFLWRGSGRAKWILGAVFVLTYGLQNALIVRALAAGQGDMRLPRETYAWLAQSTPPDEVLLAARAPTVYLYSGRHAVSFLPAPTPAVYHDRLVSRGIGAVLFEPVDLAFVQSSERMNPQEMWDASHAWARDNNQWFARVYQNEKEGTDVYAVKK